MLSTQWLNWVYVDRRGPGRKPGKKPINSRTGLVAGVTWPNTWSRFDVAVNRLQLDKRLDGIGFVLTQGDPYLGVDLDDCLQWTGDHFQISIDAQAIIYRLQSYTEISPSRRGLRVICSAPRLSINRKSDKVEVYSHDRYITVTGWHVAGLPATIETRPSELAAIVSDYFPTKPTTKTEPQGCNVLPSVSSATDDILWDKMFASRAGPRLQSLYNGDITVANNDESGAAIMLLNSLAFWCGGDAGRMRNMMLQTRLVRDKWLERRGKGDWLDGRIRDAIAWNTSRRTLP